MGLGVVAGAFGFVKLGPLIKLTKAAPTDAMFDLAIIVIWGQVELWIVLIALSIPPVWPLVKPYVQEISSKIQTRSKSWRSRSDQSKMSGNSRNWKPVQINNHSNGNAPYDMPVIPRRGQNSDVKVQNEQWPTGIRPIDTAMSGTYNAKDQPGFGLKEARDKDHLLS